MTMEAGMMPPTRSVKRPARSPLHEMDDDTHDDGLRIDKLEQLVMHTEGTPRSHVSERSVQLENHISDLQSQVAALRTSESSVQQDYMRTMVIGGLDGLPALQNATTWLTTKLSALQGPSHIGTYMKSQTFQGLLFAKFRTSVDRDTAVALLRSAEMHEKGKRVWATQDLPKLQRVQKVFIMGLRWFNVVVTVHISNQKLVCDWSPEWAQWDDLQNSSGLKQLIQRANDKLQQSTVSKGSGKSKQSLAGMGTTS
ncbi:unnamed protein product [Symbiodinium sp. CCMP2592]|nr:unnamed protein product [Symbiodinium sp. CCMP2592]